jgi:sugar phosphate isomerase/epimerase
MFGSSLGIVSNCWEEVLANGERFEDLTDRFCREGFKEIEIRDGEYLRGVSFGRFIDDIEKTMANYDLSRWRAVCDRIHRGEDWRGVVSDGDYSIVEEVDGFIRRTAGVVYSYAMTFPWLSRPADIAVDEYQITTAVKLAYLLNPSRPRLRLVSLEPVEDIDSDAAVLNLKRYKALMLESSVALTVENALHPAPLFLKLARDGGAGLAYDEANCYLTDGTELNNPEEFWRSVRIEDLASVHLKQKSIQGTLTRLGEGYVDLYAVMDRLRKGGYAGDLLLENTATDDPLADAIASRTYMS